MWHDRWNSFKYAWQGVKALVVTQPNARIHLAIAGLVVVAGFFFGVSPLEWCALILAIALVLGAEAFNSALEALVDLVSPERQPLAGRAKDLAAGAVLLSAIGAAAAGLIIFLPKIAEWLDSFLAS